MPPHISESHHYDDESFYKNMVDEMYNPTNYEFTSGDVTSGDYIDQLTSKSHVTIKFIAIVVIIQRSFSLPISDHISIHAQRHA